MSAPEHLSIEQAAAIVKSSSRILLTCHRGPDGDSLGSMLALCSILEQAGKSATMFSQDLVPRNLKWLPGIRDLQHQLKVADKFDLTIVVDCGDEKLLGSKFPGQEARGRVLVLDHHASGRPFGDYYYCDPGASSVGIIVARIAGLNEWPLTRHAAIASYVSIFADTGSFRYANTSAESLSLASELVGEWNVDPWRINEKLHERSSMARLKLLSAVLQTIELRVNNTVAFMEITPAMLESAGAGWDDTDGFVNYARAIRGVDCGVLLTSAKGGGTRVSMRSKARLYDAGKLCLELGGGGHPGAAGCVVANASVQEVRSLLERRFEALLPS